MDLTYLFFNIVGCSIMQVLSSILLPEGKIKKFVLSTISIILFYAIVSPLIGIAL